MTDTTAFTYDTERRLTRITDAKGKFTTFGYDADGRRTRTSAQTGTQWLVSCGSYTASGKTLKAWGPALTAADTTCPGTVAPVAVTDYAYDDLDRLQQVTVNLPAQEGGNRVSQTEYWPDGRVKTLRRAVGTALAQAEIGYSYTGNGRVATLTDANNNVTAYAYDGLDRRLTTRYPSPTTPGVSSTTDYEQYSYDSNGNLTMLRTRSAQSITLGYDHLNRIVSRAYPAAPGDNLAFGYDLLNLPLSANLANGSYAIGYAWDNAGRLASTTAGGKTLAYQYDAAGNRTRITWPEATAFYVTTAYDELNRPTVIKELATTPLATYTYDDLSRRTSVALGNTTTTAYGYDAQGMLQTLSHDLAGSAQDVAFTYARNQAQAISTRSWNNEAYAWSGVQDTRNFTANGLNQYTAVNGTPYGYDGNGNLSGDGSSTYTYDADNRLRSANASGTAATLSWDAGNRLRQTMIGGTTTNLLYDGERLVAEYDAGGNLLRRYVHGPGIDEPLVKYEGTGTTSRSWYYADHLGSIVATADATGTASATFNYGPFGELGSTTPGRFGYTGQQYFAPLGLYHYKARFYSPALGRFLQPDPIGYVAAINLYTYVENDPVSNTDPSGKFINYIAGGVIGAGVDVVAQYAQIVGTNQPFHINWTRTGIAFAAGVATSGASALVGGAVETLGAGAISSFVLRTTGNAAIGAIGTVTQTATLNGLQGTNDSLVTAAIAGAAFAGMGSVLADAVPAISAAINEGEFNQLSTGWQNVFRGIANLSGYEIGGPSPLAVAFGQQLGNAVGGGSSFIGGGPSTGAPGK